MMKTVKQSIEENPTEFVEELKKPNMGYWEAIKVEVIYPFLDENKPYGKRIIDKDIDKDDVYSHVYEKMVIEHKLDNLRDKSQVSSFIIEYAKAYIRSFFERNPYEDPGGAGPMQRRKVMLVPVGGSDETKEGGIEQIAQSNARFPTYKTVNGVISQRPQESTGVPSDDELPDSALTTYEALRKGFDDLWKQNPRRALALLLRYVKGLSSREIRSFMDLASENYVNQVVNVAKGDMRTNYLAVTDAIGKEDA